MVMQYFKAITHRADELNEIGRQYLDGLPFIATVDVANRLYLIALRINESGEENPDWVDLALDGCMPFLCRSPRTSIYNNLGFAQTAADARLRNLLEIAEGRETTEIDVASLAEKDIVDLYSTI